MGAGFAIAMRDLEMRGAGNILGTQQSGHIATVGYELYCELLEQAVRQLKKLPPRESVEVNIDLPGEAYLPRGYVPDMRSKIDLYRRLARLTTEAAVDDFASELADRFGPLPAVVEHLLELARLRIWAHGWGVQRDSPGRSLRGAGLHVAREASAAGEAVAAAGCGWPMAAVRICRWRAALSEPAAIFAESNLSCGRRERAA